MCLQDFMGLKFFEKTTLLPDLVSARKGELSHFQLCNFREGISQLASRFLCKKEPERNRKGENIFQSREIVKALLELLKEKP